MKYGNLENLIVENLIVEKLIVENLIVLIDYTSFFNSKERKEFFILSLSL
jgi:hypothetical protein